MRDLLGSRWVTGVVVSLVVAAAVVGAAVVTSQPAPPDRIDPVAAPEFQPDRVVVERLPATGEIRPELRLENASGTVMIDAAHENRFDRASVAPLAEAISRTGYTVRVVGDDEDESFTEGLETSEALIIIDPGERYTATELDELEAFVEDGGRLVILGEPNRVAISVSLFGAQVQEQESELTGLASRFGLAFDTRYLIDMDRNDGNYKRPLVAPSRQGSAASVGQNLSTVGNVSLYTATRVRSVGGEGVPILETYGSARLAESDTQGPIPVAVQDGRVLAIGDATFASARYHQVADNEVFLGEVVEFLVTGERVYRPTDGDRNETVADGTDDGAD